MNEAVPIATTLDGAGIDFTRRFIAEEFTPLFHTREYRSLPDAARLRYNQLHALYFNEQVAFFEQEMLSPALLALLGLELPAKLRANLRMFFDEEQRHTAMFRVLNRRCAPEFYGSGAYHFVCVAKPWRELLAGISRRPRMFPLLAWLALMQEERSLHYSKGCLENADELEPQFVAMHRAHLADEIGHVGWDEEWIEWSWPRSSRVVRLLNARLLRWMVGEFFLLPKRSAVGVIEQLVHEFPQLDVAALRRALRELTTSANYLHTLYSREITPRTFARFDGCPEFAFSAQTLPGYHPCAPTR